MNANPCKQAREELVGVKAVIYKDVLAQIDQIGAEIKSLEMGRASVNVEDVEDDLTKLVAQFETMTDRLRAARQQWIAATTIPTEVK